MELIDTISPLLSDDLSLPIARKPLCAVFRDGGFGSDAVKIDVEQIF